jgi:hypothetical protein
MRDKNAAKTALNGTFVEVRPIANSVGPPYCMLAFWKPEVMEIESVLLQQVEELSCGETVHLHADLYGAYLSSIEVPAHARRRMSTDCRESTFGTAYPCSPDCASDARLLIRWE